MDKARLKILTNSAFNRIPPFNDSGLIRKLESVITKSIKKKERKKTFGHVFDGA